LEALDRMSRGFSERWDWGVGIELGGLGLWKFFGNWKVPDENLKDPHTKLQDQWISVIYDDICNIFSSILRCHHLHYGLGFFCGLGKGGLYSSLGKFSNSCWIV
jgi:hypothetical protein